MIGPYKSFVSFPSTRVTLCLGPEYRGLEEVPFKRLLGFRFR